MEKQDFIELAKLPYKLTVAVARGVGRLLTERYMINREPPLTPEETQRIEEAFARTDEV